MYCYGVLPSGETSIGFVISDYDLTELMQMGDNNKGMITNEVELNATKDALMYKVA